jgi:outer membrane protein OmpA-like peptidoglycan-associated protein
LKPYYGAFLGSNLNFHSADFRALPGVPSCCPQYTGGFGTGLYFGALLDYPLNYQMQVTGRIGFSQLNGELKRNEQTTIIIDGKEEIGEFQHYVDSKLWMLNIEPLFTYKPLWKFPDFAVHGGFRLGFLTSADYYQIEKIVKPSDRGTFLDGRTYRNQSKGSILDSINSFQFGLKLGTSYKFPANKKQTLFIVPEIFYTLNLSNFLKERSWSVNTLSFGVGVKYRVPPPPPPPPAEPVSPPDPEIPLNLKQPILAVDVDAIEVDTNNVESKDFVMNIEDFKSFNMRPLLNYVFFDENSSELPKRFKQLDKNTAQSFTEDTLSNMNAIETYYYLLNIVGSRLKDSLNSKITIVGTNCDRGAEKNNMALSEARAQTVANYLINTWGISPDRIKIEKRNLPKEHSSPDSLFGMQENRRVEIISNDITITEPVFTVEMMRVLRTSEIKFIPKVLTEVGIKKWDFSLKYKDKNLLHEEGISEIPKQFSWKINKKNIEDIESDLAYSISAVDSIGQISNSKTKRIPVLVKDIAGKKRLGEVDREFEYYSLILFDYGKSELGYEHKKVVDFVKDRVNTNSKISIYGFTDSMGDIDVNQRLSEKRAKSVLQRLNISNDPLVEGKGETQLLYDNTLPEGRFYCRTVTIDIETPVVNNR